MVCYLVGEALAYNCIGVNYYYLSDICPGNLSKAIEFHSLHHKIMNDVYGRFIAHINIGLAYKKANDHYKAQLNFKEALRYAIQLSSPVGQTIALGHLGDSQFADVNIKKYAEKYKEMCIDLNCAEGMGNASMQLGRMYTQEKKYDQGVENFHRALSLSNGRENKV